MITTKIDHPCYSPIFGRPATLHSQPETQQDRWVLQTLNGRENGTFVEVGAFDGVYHSNTLCLERDFGWNGWLIESDPGLAAQAAKVRRAKVLNYTIGPTCRRERFFTAGQWSGLVEYTRPNLLVGHTVYNNPVVERPTVDLRTLLRPEHLPAVIDYLSIDVEGAEYAILKSYFENDPPAMFRCMTVEVGEKCDDLNKLLTLLEPLGYRLDNVRAWESYWHHPELCCG